MTTPAYRVRPRDVPAPAVPVLDAAQQHVVDHDAGRLLVLAGPGTGKTTTLVEAAVARVERGVPIDELLLVTFGRRAAAELRDRITARLDRTVREPLARTLHSYAFGVLRLAAAQHGQSAPRLLAAAEQDVIVRELIAGHLDSGTSPWPPHLASALRTRGFAAEVRDLLLRAVERGLDGPTLSRLGELHHRADWVAAGRFLAEYQDVTALARPGSYDPAELVRAAVRTLEADPQLLAAERARRRRIFVDEYQDTDPAQAELLGLIAEGADELVVVGDPDQSIYVFRGADPDALGDLLTGAERIALTTSRRCGPQLLAASRRIAERLPGPAGHRRLSAAADADPVAPASAVADGTGPAVRVAVFASPSDEASAVAAHLRRAHLGGMPWSRMAILIRGAGPLVGPLRRACSVAGVPVAVRSEDGPLAEQPAVAALLTLLELALHSDRPDEDVAERLLLGPVGRGDALMLRRLRRLIESAGLGSLADLVTDPGAAATLPEPAGRPVRRVATVLAAGRRAFAAGGDAEQVLWALWDATGLAGRWEAASVRGGHSAAVANRNLDAVIALFDAAARFSDRLPAASPAQFIEHLSAQELPADRPELRSDAVALLTAHAAKGLEWDVVCVAGVQEGVWPDLRPRGSLLGVAELVDVLSGRASAGVVTGGGPGVRLAEERRLFYVSVTRARQRLLVTATRGEEEQPSRFLEELVPDSTEQPAGRPDRAASLPGLVAELRAAVSDPQASPVLRAAAAEQLATLAEADVAGAAPEQWWGLAAPSCSDPVISADRAVSVSPSRVEAYLRCEVKALLEELGARDEDAVSASLGTLVHHVAQLRPDGSAAELDALLDRYWASLDFGARWLSDNKRAEAREMVRRLAEWVVATRTALELVGVEQRFSITLADPSTDAGAIVLSGSVDRLERDRAGRLVVIDLKTGSAAKESDVARHPQLGAYQVAVEAGGFPEAGVRSGGAELVNLKVNKSAKVQAQPALEQSDDPEWALSQIRHVADLLRSTTFHAMVNAGCGNCALRGCCPLCEDGRQVTS